MKRLSVCIFVCIVGAMCFACTKGSSTLSNVGEITQSMSELPIADAETSQDQIAETEISGETETETPKETETDVEYELNPVESLEDDGKEMSAAEALRSTMKGKHSALELMERKRLFVLGSDNEFSNAAENIENVPDTGLARINMLTYNRGGSGVVIIPNATNWERFICVDLDGNGTKEVIADSFYFCAILHYTGDEVYITNISSKFRPDFVYENGVWETSSGAFDRQLARLYPVKGAVYISYAVYEYIVPDYGDPTFNQYKIMGKDVTEEELNAYLEELIGGLTPLEWHEFTEENIDKYVVD